MSFNISLARTYKWQTENHVDQFAFVHALVELFQSLIGGQLHLVGVNDPSTDPAPGEQFRKESGAYIYSFSQASLPSRIPVLISPLLGKEHPYQLCPMHISSVMNACIHPYPNHLLFPTSPIPPLVLLHPPTHCAFLQHMSQLFEPTVHHPHLMCNNCNLKRICLTYPVDRDLGTQTNHLT